MSTCKGGAGGGGGGEGTARPASKKAKKTAACASANNPFTSPEDAVVQREIDKLWLDLNKVHVLRAKTKAPRKVKHT